MAQIDILMAVYNGEHYVSQQIDSILRQTEGDWRLLIQDDCSSDATLSICEGYARKHPDKIVCLHSEVNSGAAQRNFFSLMEKVEAPYVMFSDHDDVWLPDKIEATLAVMKNLEGDAPGRPLLVHTDLTVVEKDLKEKAFSMAHLQNLNMRSGLRQLLVQNVVTGCTVMANRPLIRLACPMPRRAVMHDWWLALLASALGEIGYLDRPTMLYRQHNKNQVGAKDVRSLRYCLNRFMDKAGAQRSLQDTCAQAGEFLERYASLLSGEQKILLKEYGSLMQKSKMQRVSILFRHGLWKHGFLRKIGQIFFV